jgi:hypothetical protein
MLTYTILSKPHIRILGCIFVGNTTARYIYAAGKGKVHEKTDVKLRVIKI